MANAVDMQASMVMAGVMAPPATTAGAAAGAAATDGEEAIWRKLRMQNCYLAYTVVTKMLSADRLNGLRPRESRFTHEVINEASFKGTVEVLEKSCTYLMKEKMGEMERLVGTLDITDSQLCTNFQRVSEHLMQDDIRFGRIGSLFFFTFVLCKRLYTEGRQKEVDSVIDWLAGFLNEKITPWLIKKHGGQWAAIKDGIRTEFPSTGKQGKVGSGWVTMAALGVGAFVVGALAMR